MKWGNTKIWRTHCSFVFERFSRFNSRENNFFVLPPISCEFWRFGSLPELQMSSICRASDNRERKLWYTVKSKARTYSINDKREVVVFHILYYDLAGYVRKVWSKRREKSQLQKQQIRKYVLSINCFHEISYFHFVVYWHLLCSDIISSVLIFTRCVFLAIAKFMSENLVANRHNTIIETFSRAFHSASCCLCAWMCVCAVALP